MQRCVQRGYNSNIISDICISKAKTMTFKKLLPFIAATLVCGSCFIVEARQPQQPATKKPETAAQPVQPKWKLFRAPDGRFTVLMPGIPSKETQTQKTYMGEIDLEIFFAQPPKQQVAYVVVYNEFPHSYGTLTNPQTILEQAQAMVLKTTKSNLIRQRNIRSSNGHPGKEIEFVNAGGKITRSRMYVAEGRLYQVMAITTKKQQQTLSKTITGYLNSFQVVLR
ncbi:hypothetical protein NIES21_03160 [Anabaenopsis circularis NIES-21]|uniref:Uncharacterized protein n=1 Tax=Anabaenopsis circularis NIES-21 TaxID=1085406 RepID=A0A1Z4GAQ6_9CYAN|nr:hypothetical protein NIES21_03160 [Anabaenopsis circularis NIES-21]